MSEGMRTEDAIEILETLLSSIPASEVSVGTAIRAGCEALREVQKIPDHLAREREQAYLNGWEDARKHERMV